MKYNKFVQGIKSNWSTNITNNPNNNEFNLNSESTNNNNKISIECSYLINEIKRKNNSLLPIQNYKKRLHGKNTSLFRDISKNLPNNKSHIYSKLEQYSSKLPQMVNNTNKSISLTSLFNIPKEKSRNRFNINLKVIKNNNLSLNLHKKKNIVEKFNNRRNYFGISNFMKENFYSDLEKRYNNQIKTRYFRNDSAIKNEIIAVKKFGIFWNKFIDYCEPIIKFKKYQLFRINSNKKNDIKKLNIIKSNSVSNFVKKINLFKQDL